MPQELSDARKAPLVKSLRRRPRALAWQAMPTPGVTGPSQAGGTTGVVASVVTLHRISSFPLT